MAEPWHRYAKEGRTGVNRFDAGDPYSAVDDVTPNMTLMDEDRDLRQAKDDHDRMRCDAGKPHVYPSNAKVKARRPRYILATEPNIIGKPKEP